MYALAIPLMNPWREAFEKHQFVTKIDGALTVLEAASLESLSARDLDQFARLIKALKFSRARLKSIDPDLVGQSSLNNLGGWMTTITNNVQNFPTTPNLSYIQTANNVLDNVIELVRSFRITAKDSDQVASAAAAAFQDKAVEEIARVRTAADEADSELSSVKKELSRTKEAIEQQKGRLDQSIAEFQKQFSQSEAERAKEYAASVAKLTDQVAGQVTQFQKDFESDLTARKEKGDEHLAFLAEREKQVNEIFGAIGSASFAGHFKNTADQQEKTADRYRTIALILMICMVGIAGVAFYHTLRQETPDWKLFAFRLATSLVFLIPALYAARESAKHRARESRLRKSHLELAAIDAYLILLPEETRNALKEKLTEKFFGQAETTEKDETVTGHALLNVIEIAVKNLTSGK